MINLNKKVKCGLNTKDIIRCVYATVILSIVMNSTACKNNDSDSRDSNIEQIPVSANSDLDGSTCLDASISSASGSETPQSEDVTTTTEATLPTKNPNPSEYSDYLDIPMPCDSKIILDTMVYDGKKINLFSDNEMRLLFDYGFDNPFLLNNLRNVIGDESITCYEVDYCQKFHDYMMQYVMKFDRTFGGEYMKKSGRNIFYFDIARYILEENGLRMWVDEIPYEFFEQKVNYLYNDNITLSDEELCNQMLYSVEYTPDGNDFTGFSSIKCNPGTDEYMKTISEFFFDAAAFYNSVRLSIIYDLGANQIRNTDGHNVIQFADEKIYNKVRETFKDFYGYDFDPIHNGPETREDLVINFFNIPVEEFDEAAKAIGGVKFERTNPYDQTYDQSNQ